MNHPTAEHHQGSSCYCVTQTCPHLPSHAPLSGVGGAGIFAIGFNNPINLITNTERSLGAAANKGIAYDYVVFMLGINDLLREGRSAADVMEGLKRLYSMALDRGATVVALPPFSAPGFVSRWAGAGVGGGWGFGVVCRWGGERWSVGRVFSWHWTRGWQSVLNSRPCQEAGTRTGVEPAVSRRVCHTMNACELRAKGG